MAALSPQLAYSPLPSHCWQYCAIFAVSSKYCSTRRLTARLLQSHVPGYVKDYEKLQSAGAEVIACVSVNDAFVMKAWGDDTKATGKVRPASVTLAKLSLILTGAAAGVMSWLAAPSSQGTCS